MKKIFWLFSLLLLTSSVAWSQGMTKHVTWKSAVKMLSADTAELQITATVEKTWHLYAIKKADGEGPNALEITFSPSSNYQLVGKMKEPKPQEGFDKNFECNTFFFTDKVTFKQKIKVKSEKDFVVACNIWGQACTEGTCTLVTDDIEIKVNGVSQLDTEAASGDSAEEIEAEEPTIEEQKKEENTQTEIKQAGIQEENKGKEESLLLFFLTSIAAGLVGLLMPCVFPMIPMTVSYFTKSGNQGKKQALVYGLSIVVIFVVFGLGMSAILGPDFGNKISTHWIPNILFAIIFVIFALSMFGYFEITLPSKWVNKSSKAENKGGMLGVFFMALTLVLVSFSCTLPIAGAVVLNAASGSFFKPLLGMLGFSLGIAVPFTLFALFPGLLKKAPKSGSWMNTLKVVLAFVELAFALKFLNVPDQTYHWGILDREVYLAFWIVIFSMLGFYLLGKIRFPADPEMPVQKSWFRFSTSIFVFAFVVYMIPGMFGAPLNAISGWLPSVETHDFDLNHVIREEIKLAGFSENTKEAPRYSDKLSLPHGIEGYFDYDQALNVAKKMHKPLFIDFTGHGCTNCRNVENKVWKDTKIREKFASELVVASLYVDDKVVELEEQDWFTKPDGEVIKKLGPKNMYISQNTYHQNSQPCYFVVDEDGSVLAGPFYYTLNVEEYLEFLNKGIEAYHKKHGQQ